MKYTKNKKVKSPKIGTSKSAGIDIFTPEKTDLFSFNADTKTNTPLKNGEIVIKPNNSVLIPCGLIFNVPENHALIVMNKSSIAIKKSIVVGACVIDEDYTGEVYINLHNIGNQTQIIKSGEKLTQLVCLPITYVDLKETTIENLFNDKISERGDGAFGSTGV